MFEARHRKNRRARGLRLALLASLILHVALALFVLLSPTDRRSMRFGESTRNQLFFVDVVEGVGSTSPRSRDEPKPSWAPARDPRASDGQKGPGHAGTSRDRVPTLREPRDLGARYRWSPRRKERISPGERLARRRANAAPSRPRAGSPRQSQATKASHGGQKKLALGPRAESTRCLLSMRCGEANATAPRPKGKDLPPSRVKDRFASFWGAKGRARRRKGAERAYEIRAAGLQLVRYQDGGRTIRSTSGGLRRPPLGRIKLAEMASGFVGKSTGKLACNPYRHFTRRRSGAGRTLVLLVDSSSSMSVRSRRKTAQICAAGAALAALERGLAVEVLNFSTHVRRQLATRDARAIYETIALNQDRFTRMPSLSRIGSPRSSDIVLISDGAIELPKGVTPAYLRLFARAKRRGLLMKIGSKRAAFCSKCDTDRGETCKSRCYGKEVVFDLRKAGFSAVRVDLI